MLGRTIAALLLCGCATTPDGLPQDAQALQTIRIASFNVALSRDAAGQLLDELSTGYNAQAQAVAEIIQRVRPDILVLGEVDFDDGGPQGSSRVLTALQENYLAVSQKGAAPIEYAYAFAVPSNTGLHNSAFADPPLDLNRDGVVDLQTGSDAYAGDALGYGRHPGHYAFALLSKFPIDRSRMRTFQELLWRDVPAPILPVLPGTGEPFYSAAALAVLRLSSKNHVDVPVQIGAQRIHVLASHPTPPGFDGPEDRNGLRNAAEVQFWVDYLDVDAELTDDAGWRGGLVGDALFVIAGDLNADPVDGDSAGVMQRLLDHPRVNANTPPASQGGIDRARAQAGSNLAHAGDPALDTGDFHDAYAGNLRVDYALPSTNLRLRNSGVFWPADDDPLVRLTGDGSEVVSSDHRMVWIDVQLPGR
ncbi:MAG: endonuclease/exonuclease/phosphatase family protein [Pseudomonadota bacterium]